MHTKTGYRNNQVSNEINEETSHFSEVYMQKGESSSIKKKQQHEQQQQHRKRKQAARYKKTHEALLLFFSLTQNYQNHTVSASRSPITTATSAPIS
jgi:hypothetical protein